MSESHDESEPAAPIAPAVEPETASALRISVLERRVASLITHVEAFLNVKVAE